MVDLIGKIVEISTVEMLYTGRLVEVNENEAYLESESGWITVPIDRIAFIREKKED